MGARACCASRGGGAHLQVLKDSTRCAHGPLGPAALVSYELQGGLHIARFAQDPRTQGPAFRQCQQPLARLLHLFRACTLHAHGLDSGLNELVDRESERRRAKLAGGRRRRHAV